ncbi:3'-5' exonuclease [Thalassotalea ponticola]|uniref:3'-5' exonuclease n=1 Tax=Thalassotalea ponticola TaxID=1523392 RepID=UPI0025B2F173|nr:3'-5' exonuclease [Thalassotalea ponticola]MDN3651178.1 3'-5' exonuclease [Thalassotalea ponticola]
MTSVQQYANTWLKRYPTWGSAEQALLTLTAKEKIKTLPQYSAGERDIVIVSKNSVNASIDDMLTHRWLGFDTEARPNFRAEDNFATCLIQIATPNTCYLLHLNELQSFSALAPVLEAKHIVKIGIGLRGDSKNLRANHAVDLVNSLDLVAVFKRLGRKKGAGAQHLVATLFNQYLRKSKRVSLSNWSKTPLTGQQISYAAQDAMVPLDCFVFLDKISRNYTPHCPAWLTQMLQATRPSDILESPR